MKKLTFQVFSVLLPLVALAGGEQGMHYERSILAGSEPIEFPDYTRGGWKTAKPFTVDEIDMKKFDFKNVVHAKDAQKT